LVLCLGAASVFAGEPVSKDGYSVTAPDGWKEISPDTFSPLSEKEDISKSMIQILVRPTEVGGLTKINKDKILAKKREMGEKVSSQKTKVIHETRAWDVYSVSRSFGEERKIHEIYFVSDGKLCVLALTASRGLFKSADKEFLDMVLSFKLNSGRKGHVR
jgi:hypothetical protein